MYNTLKLEKGLYNLAGKSFTEALTAADPNEGYTDTELQGLDAFERQLKRFDIKVSGANSDTVAKFFQTTETAVLFPEFVKRAVSAGLENPVLTELVAASTVMNGVDYRGFTVTTAAAQGGALPETTIALTTDLIALVKTGRIISTSYEAIRQQRLDTFAVTLKAVGAQLSSGIVTQAVAALIKGITPTTMGGATFNYAELAAFWGKFEDANMTTILASPATVSKILGFEQMKYACADFMATGIVKTPFGASLVKVSGMSDTIIIGLDKTTALEMVASGDVILEADKLIDRQVDRIVVSACTGFSKIIPDAVKTLKIA